MIELILKLLSSFFSFILNLFSSKNAQNDLRREQAEFEANDLREELESLHRESVEHEKEILKILSPTLSDDEASRMLSEEIDDDHTVH